MVHEQKDVSAAANLINEIESGTNLEWSSAVLCRSLIFSDWLPRLFVEAIAE